MSVTSSRHNERGFTVVEMIVSMAIMVGITGVIFQLVNPSHGAYRTQPEVSDMQQRLRVSTSSLSNDLLMAGAGSPAGGLLTGSLMNYFAAVQPYRMGQVAPDPPATFYRADAITIFFVPVGSPQTSLEDPMPQPSSELKVFAEPSCAGTGYDLSCKFKAGMRVIVFDDTGAYDDMTLTHVQDGSNHLQHNKQYPGNDLSKKYLPGAQIAQITQHTYHLNRATRQLMLYDGDQRDEALVDNVVDLQFEYFAEARPPMLMTTATGTTFTTYGPRPPQDPMASNGTTWPPGENCAFTKDAGGAQVSRIPELAAGSQALIKMTPAQMTDGPWCPDAAFPTRFDADLLRVRKIGVVVRVQVTSESLRGPVGTLFTNGGSSRNGRMMVPDQEIRFEVTPRNFNLGR